MSDVALDLLDRYRSAYLARDVPGIAALFAYPLQITMDSGEIGILIVPSAEDFEPSVREWFALYESIGVAEIEMLTQQTTVLSPLLSIAFVHWGLIDAQGRSLHEFHNVYVVCLGGDGPRIASVVAPNEIAEYRPFVNPLSDQPDRWGRPEERK